MESNVSRMRFHVNQEVNLKREVTIEEIVESIDKTTVDDINRLFREYVNLEKSAVFLYGDVADFMIY